MRKLTLLLTLLCCNTAYSADTTQNGLEQEARQLAQRFIGELKPQLKQSMAEGGPALAIEVCASAAPRIADALSTDSGWLVKRVSLNARNVSRAMPDAWETQVLQQFDERRAAGEEAAELHYAETVKHHYRYMQAQLVDGICLTCHGTALSPEAATTLSEYYPDDAATGYSLGQVRGAISLTKTIAP